ncbi:unnamed protein product [Caretta caretta]
MERALSRGFSFRPSGRRAGPAAGYFRGAAPSTVPGEAGSLPLHHRYSADWEPPKVSVNDCVNEECMHQEKIRFHCWMTQNWCQVRAGYCCQNLIPLLARVWP